jgi:signal transduction histidine kinase
MSEFESQSTAARPRRRWFQFSLLTLIAFVTLVAIVCAWLVYHAAEARRTAAKIRAIQTHVESVTSEYQKTKALSDVMAKGGEAYLLAICGREMSLAQAELDLTQGDNAAAIEHMKTALRFADDCVRDMSVNMGGPPDYGPAERCEAAAAESN